MGTTTTNYSWYKPAEHEGATGASYHVPFNANWDDLDTRFKALLDGRNADAAAIAVFQTFPVNARTYLKGDGTAEDAGAISAFAAAAQAAGHCYIPGGTYYMPDSSSLFGALSDNTLIQGAGRGTTIISTKNAYAFAAPGGSSSVVNVSIRDLSTVLRSGSTSGGGVRAVSSPGYHAGWDLYSLECNGIVTSVDPLIYVDGWIGSYMDLVSASGGGGDGIKVETAGFPSNAWGIARFRAAANALAGTSYAGLRIKGVLGHIGPGIIESNKGYGMFLPGAASVTVFGIHYEDNWNSNMEGEISSCIIERNRFHFNDASAVATAAHVRLTSGLADQRLMNVIQDNSFADYAASGKAIEIGTNVDYTFIANNRGARKQDGSIVDNGKNTRYGGNDADAGMHQGAGSPEGVVTAVAGSLYLRTDGSTSTTLYVKTSGVGNTGWTAK